ncbi:hypothetical protein DPEC_G00084070 [Dallia pectoralis]|uniref:Uncharacterized protein n=1 Tax=Dallia pectoralis TaxID=75939 RepID=A0ACC2GZ53_DALPE|nr:hypothetical protein DPEC_G00084070 [Dallia pectoralis]
MSLLTVCGNLLVVIPVIHFKQLHTPTNYLILSLAVSDLLLGVIVMPPSMIYSLEGCWTKITVHVVFVMVLVTWGISALVGFGIIFLELNIWGIEEFYYEYIACEGRCALFQNKVSSIVSSVISFYIPGVGMLSLYLKIFLIAQRQVRSLQSVAENNPVGKSQRKATKTLAIIMGVFLSFWTPFFVCNCIDPFIGYSIPPGLFVTFVWIGYLNSTINPMVYAFFYSWFRKALRMIISAKIFQPDSSILQLFSE